MVQNGTHNIRNPLLGAPLQFTEPLLRLFSTKTGTLFTKRRIFSHRHTVVQKSGGHDCIDLVLRGFATVFTQTLLAENLLSESGDPEDMVEVMSGIDRRDPAHPLTEFTQDRIHFRAHSGL